jgi:hypothetical protein
MKIRSESSSAKTQNLYQAHIQLKPVTSPTTVFLRKRILFMGKRSYTVTLDIQTGECGSSSFESNRPMDDS